MRLTAFSGVLVCACIGVLTVAGCDGDKKKPTPDAGTDAGTDAGEISPFCEDGVARLEFTDAPSDKSLRAMAADFTVATTEGSWNLSENWSGCDSYLLIQDLPKQNNSEFGYDYWDIDSDVTDLFANTPLNVHYFFMSTLADEADRLDALDSFRALADTAMGSLPAEDQAALEGRVHYVTERAAEIGGWVGQIMISPGWGAAVDRLQKIRYIGSYADHAHYNSALPWPFGPNVAMAANEVIYYNFEAVREDRLNSQDATVLQMWENIPVADEPDDEDHHFDVTFPDASTMAGFDSMEFDLTLNCGGVGEFTECPAWDYNVYLLMCDDSDPTVCDYEVGHWITSYHREGRWVHDVSGILPIFAAGGDKRFKISISDPWYVTLSIRLFNQDKDPAPAETIDLFHGDHHFGPDYNANYTPMTINIPADAVKVEIASAITGHGMQSPGNCAEFCNTDHHFYVNGTDNVIDFGDTIGDQYGCMAQIADGTVPNQYGTWWYGRGGWCPGKHVDLTMTDITEQVDVGQDNTFDYDGFYLGADYPTVDGWQYIRMASWVVVSK
jgi:peptide-N-glycosidase F-like protein